MSQVLKEIAASSTPTLDARLAKAQNLQREKWDWALPDGLLRKAYASHYLDLDEGLAWIRATVAESLPRATPPPTRSRRSYESEIGVSNLDS